MGKTITRRDLHKVQISGLREEQKEAGAFDGRFRTKVKGGGDGYKRNQKHRKSGWDD